jgi:hypothetical protein
MNASPLDGVQPFILLERREVELSGLDLLVAELALRHQGSSNGIGVRVIVRQAGQVHL